MLTHEQIKEAVNKIAPRYNIERVYLFGSYARGDATEDSDVDFRIVGGDFPTLINLGGLYSDFEENFNAKIDLIMNDALTERFYTLINEDEILIYAKI